MQRPSSYSSNLHSDNQPCVGAAPSIYSRSLLLDLGQICCYGRRVTAVFWVHRGQFGSRGHLGQPRSLGSATVVWVNYGHLGQSWSVRSTAVSWVNCGQLAQPWSVGSTAVSWVNRGQLGQPWSVGSTTVSWVNHGQLGQPWSFGSTTVTWVSCGQLGQPRSVGSNVVSQVSHGYLGQPQSLGSAAVVWISHGHFGLNGLLVPTIVELIPCVSAIVQLAYDDGVTRPCNLPCTIVHNRLYVPYVTT